jgi:hypothetical protein
MTHVRFDNGVRSVASCHGPSSTCSSTFEMPRAPAWAIPPMGTSVCPSALVLVALAATVSITEVAFMRAIRSQPRTTQ